MTVMNDTDAASLAARIQADKRQQQIQRIADQLSTLCVIEQPTFFVALEALKQATMNLSVSMLLMDGLDDATVLRRVDLAVNEAQDLYRLLAALGRDIHTRGPHVALADLRQNMKTLDAHLPTENKPDHGPIN